MLSAAYNIKKAAQIVLCEGFQHHTIRNNQMHYIFTGAYRIMSSVGVCCFLSINHPLILS